MAQPTLESDERVISTHAVTLVERGAKLPATIYLTTHRLVVAPGAGLGPSWGMAVNPLAALFGAFRKKREPRIYHQIRRDAFESIEQDDDLIVFHDDGEGYKHVSFAITPDVFAHTPESFEVWQQRMHEWASGTETSALPTAAVVDRS